ncbi:MAG: hypothetical protein WKF84_24840 [Pyrinomonadaceae bacterium]
MGYDLRERITSYTMNGGSVMSWLYSYNHFGENTGRVTFADNLLDNALDRSYQYDQVGRLQYAHTGYEARMHVTGQLSDGGAPGYYSQQNNYDIYGNITQRSGWGAIHASYGASFANNRIQSGRQYDGRGQLHERRLGADLHLHRCRADGFNHDGRLLCRADGLLRRRRAGDENRRRCGYSLSEVICAGRASSG